MHKLIQIYCTLSVQKSEDKIRSNKLLEACLNNDLNILEEIKKLSKRKTDQANSIDGVNVENHFPDINDTNELKIISHQLDKNINHLNLMDVSILPPGYCMSTYFKS